MRHLLALVLFAFTIPARADMVLYNVTGDLSSFSGPGFLGFSLATLGAPTNNVTATVSNLTFTGGSYDFGTGTPSLDVNRSGNTIVFGGSELGRFYDIQVNSFGSGLFFQLALTGPGVLGSGSGDGWSFSLIAVDQGPGFEFLNIDIPPSGEPVVFATSGLSVNVVPEPSTYAMLALAVGGVVLRVRRKR